MTSNDELKTKFSNWCMKAQFNFLENDLFQPIGLEISCTNLVLETKEDYFFNGIEKSNIDEENYPLAYYSPIDDSIHIFIDHHSFQIRESDTEKQALLAFLLFHEANHRLLLHIKRGTEKEHSLWNIASDMEIHNMFYVYNEIMKCDKKYASSRIYQYAHDYIENFLFEKTNKEKNEGLFEKDFLQNTAEEIYTILQNSKEVNVQQFQLQMSGNNANNPGGSGTGMSDQESENDQKGKNSKKPNGKSGDGEENDEKDGDGKTDKKDGKESKNGKNGKEENEGAGESSSNSSKNSQGGGNTVTVKTTTYKLPSGQKITSTEIQWPKVDPNKNNGGEENDADKEAGEITRKTLMENNIQKKVGELFDENEEKTWNRGTISNACKSFLRKLFHVKIDWKKILRNSLMTALEKSEYFSWAKPRTSLFGLPNAPYLPDQIDDETAYGTVIIARDESGSMSDKECEAAAGIIADSKEYYKKIVVLKHDTKITSVNEIYDLDDNAKKMLLQRNSHGGTSHKEVFKFIKEYSKKNEENERISCCIFITDMYSDIEETQNDIPDSIPRIWLAPAESANHYKEIVKGKIIPIEV